MRIAGPRRLLAALPILFLMGGTVALPPPAFGQERNPKTEAKAEVDKAQLHYKLGRFEDALAAYIRAYELFSAPALLFNIGQCHKNLKRYDRAIFFFEGYLREESNPDRRSLAEDLIAKSKADLQAQRFEPQTPVAVPAVPVPPAATRANSAIDTDTVLPPADLAATAVGESAFGAPVLIETAAPPPQTPVTKKWWFWTAIGAGLLAIAGGTVAYYASGDTTIIPPSGSVGTLDRR